VIDNGKVLRGIVNEITKKRGDKEGFD